MKSDTVRKGTQQAPHRSLFNALGMTKEEMDNPLVGIVSSYNEIVAGHMNLDKIVNAVKLGVAMAGGTPVVFPAIAVCDGIAMGHVGMKYSLVTRDLIADSTEAMTIAHQFDALVMVPNCDKNVPGLLMAAARVNVPTVFVSGGPMLAGHVKGQKTSLSSMFEAVGSYAAGKMSEEDVLDYEQHACPTCGSCSGMYTANSMNCLTEAIGMANAMAATGLPYIISFMICRDGRLIDGTFIHDAIDAIEKETSTRPLCYMANCVHPDVLHQALLHPRNDTPLVRQRFQGIQANAANLSPEELDGCDHLISSSPEELADRLMTLLWDFPLKICGGCCGTNQQHMHRFAEMLAYRRDNKAW